MSVHFFFPFQLINLTKDSIAYSTVTPTFKLKQFWVLNCVVHWWSEGLGFRQTASGSPRRSLQYERSDFPSGRRSPKRSAKPERTHFSMPSSHILKQGCKLSPEFPYFPTWCCSSGDIMETSSRFTFKLLTSLLDFKACLASNGGKYGYTKIWLIRLSHCPVGYFCLCVTRAARSQF